jgi:hypothetical protein
MPIAAALSQAGLKSRTKGDSLVFAKCSGGYGCFYKHGGKSAIFRQCIYLDNSAGAMGHGSWATSQDLMESCHFVNTRLWGGEFLAGSVLIDNCLFAGDVQSTASFIPTSGQIGHTSLEGLFHRAWMPTCGQVAELPTDGAMFVLSGLLGLLSLIILALGSVL